MTKKNMLSLRMLESKNLIMFKMFTPYTLSKYFYRLPSFINLLSIASTNAVFPFVYVSDIVKDSLQIVLLVIVIGGPAMVFKYWYTLTTFVSVYSIYILKVWYYLSNLIYGHFKLKPFLRLLMTFHALSFPSLPFMPSAHHTLCLVLFLVHKANLHIRHEAPVLEIYKIQIFFMILDNLELFLFNYCSNIYCWFSAIQKWHMQPKKGKAMK